MFQLTGIVVRNRIHYWMIYTCAIGSIPVIARFLVSIFDLAKIDLLSAPDIAVFGLVLHLSVINELNHSKGPSGDQDWSPRNLGLSVIFIIVYSLLLMISLIKDGIDGTIVFTVLAMAVASLLQTYSFYRSIAVSAGAE